MQCYVFFGIQGSGKGTQAELLSRDLNFQHVNIGDLFRDQVSRQTELGQRVQAVIARGELVSDDLVFEIIGASLVSGREGIVFDGFPRTLKQAQYLVEHFEVRQVFFLELEEAVAVARISSRRVCSSCGANYNLISHSPLHENVCDLCGGELAIRRDDRPEAIAQRLKEYYEQTEVLREFFAGLNILAPIDASSSVTSISASIRKVIHQLEH